MKTSLNDHKLESRKLLKLVKQKGILIEVKPKDTSLLYSETPTSYKKSLGAVIKYSIFKNKNVAHVYDVYEDFDGTIKYYDYPQSIDNKEALEEARSMAIVSIQISALLAISGAWFLQINAIIGNGLVIGAIISIIPATIRLLIAKRNN